MWQIYCLYISLLGLQKCKFLQFVLSQAQRSTFGVRQNSREGNVLAVNFRMRHREAMATTCPRQKKYQVRDVTD